MDSKLETIFLRARALAPSERSAYLDQTFGDEPDGRRQVEALLASDGPAGKYFNRLSTQLDGLLEQVDQFERLPKRIGDYRPTELLGRGGMGAVYLASRGDGQFDKEVAIKVLPARLADPEAEHRFRRERQILAGLEHPNITRLLDGGISADGLPYFVMEYVAGLPIDNYADRHQLSIERRLELFLQVCSATEYAHQNLVLHRDLKPDNILVNDAGEVKLLDFGVAKIMSEAESAPATQTTHLPLTPRFASPEQLNGQAVSTRSDVYALGMLLYSLLTGVHAHKLQQRTMSESLRMLSEEEATLASQRLKRLRGEDDAREFVLDTARQRQLSPQKLVERLGGDLDNIMAKSLKLVPAERYPSAASMAEDIQRHLNHEPVSARAPSSVYVASRFVRRHRVPVALSTVIATLLLALAAGASWTAWRTAQQAQAIALESSRANAIKDFLIGVFKAAHPNQAKGEVVTAAQLVDSGAERVREELSGQPELQAELFNTFGDIYGLMGNYEQSEALWQSELSVRSATPDPNQGAVADVLQNLSNVVSARGDHKRAIDYAQQAVAVRQSMEDPIGLANSRYRLGRLAQNAGKLDRAEAIFREVMPVFAADTQSQEQYTMTLHALGNLLRTREHLSDALEMIEQALSRQLAQHGENHTFTAQILQDLGATQRKMQQTIESQQSYHRALKISEALLGSDHLEVAFALSGLAQLAETNEKPQEAEQYYLRALKIFEARLQAGHPNTAITQLNLGDFYRGQNDCTKGEPLLRSGLAMMLTALPTHSSVADGRQNLARCVLQAGNAGEAESLLLSAKQAVLDNLGPDHPRVRSIESDLNSLPTRSQQPDGPALTTSPTREGP